MLAVSDTVVAALRVSITWLRARTAQAALKTTCGIEVVSSGTVWTALLMLRCLHRCDQNKNDAETTCKTHAYTLTKRPCKQPACSTHTHIHRSCSAKTWLLPSLAPQADDLDQDAQWGFIDRNAVID